MSLFSPPMGSGAAGQLAGNGITQSQAPYNYGQGNGNVYAEGGSLPGNPNGSVPGVPTGQGPGGLGSGLAPTTINASAGNTNTNSNTQTNQNGLQNGWQNSTTNTSGTNSGTNANTYNASQLAAQGQLGGQYSQYLQNGIPQSFAAPQAEINAYNQQFQNLIAPGIAAQQGGGSAGIGQEGALGLSQLMGNLYATQSQNYLTGLGQLQNMAYTPTGNTYSGQQTGTSNTTGTYGSATSSNGTQNNQGNQNGQSLSVLQQLANPFQG